MSDDVMTVKGHNGTVEFDGHAVTILRRGFVARATHGKSEKQIPIGQITAVQFKSAGLTNGFIQFTLGGAIERQSRLGRRTTDAAKDENSVVFHAGHRAAFEKLRDAVQAAIAAHHRAPATPPERTSDIPEQIKKLADLREVGAITHEDFAAKKRELLERM